MKSARFLNPIRERNWGQMPCRFDTAEAREELALAMRIVRGQSRLVQGDYKDVAAWCSAALFDVLQERQWPFAEPAKSALKLAQRMNLLDGYNCPRQTLAAWA